MSNEILPLLLYATVYATCGLTLVAVLRRPLRFLFGASVAYLVWLLVPAASLAVLIPSRRVGPGPLGPINLHIALPQAAAAALPAANRLVASGLLWIWIMGVCSLLMTLAWRQLRYVRRLPIVRIENGFIHVADDIGPLVVGLIRPRIVLPINFETRYTAAERDLVLLHERLHVRRGDLIANGICMLVRCVFWFNPLIHLAASRFEFDQELACDEAVIRHQPTARPTYANAMLKSQVVNMPSAVACSWPRGHFLKERIMQLRAPSTPRARRAGGKALVLLTIAFTAFGAWASQPGPPPSEIRTIARSMRVESGGKIVLRGPHVTVHAKGPLVISPGPDVKWIPGMPPRVQWHGNGVHITLGGHPVTTSGDVAAALGKDSIDLTVSGAVEVPQPGWMKNAECVPGCNEGPASRSK